MITALLSHPSMAQDLDALKAGVVKITTKTGQVGAGFIVRLESERVYIITAAHVIAGDLQPDVEFFTGGNIPIGNFSVKGAVLPGAELNDDIRGLALVVVRGKDKKILEGIQIRAFVVPKTLHNPVAFSPFSSEPSSLSFPENIRASQG